MNRTALALLQERLWQAATDFDARPQGANEGELRTVLQALERFDQGRYGLCERCGQAIDPDQLFDLPQRFACAACDPVRTERP